MFKQFNCCVERQETFQKRSIRNRTTILGANGSLILSVPLKRGKTKQMISDVEVAFDGQWQREHMRSIQSAYGNAPYFDYYIDSIKELINSCDATLIAFFERIYNFFKNKLGLAELQYTTEYKFICDDIYDMRKATRNYSCQIPEYFQVFESKFGFKNDLSILDLLFNLGPESSQILLNTKFTFTNGNN